MDEEFETIDVDMAKEPVGAQMRAQVSIREEVLIGRWGWDDTQGEPLTWDEEGVFGDP